MSLTLNELRTWTPSKLAHYILENQKEEVLFEKLCLLRKQNPTEPAICILGQDGGKNIGFVWGSSDQVMAQILSLLKMIQEQTGTKMSVLLTHLAGEFDNEQLSKL